MPKLAKPGALTLENCHDLLNPKRFTYAGPFEALTWEKRTALVKDYNTGEVIFEQKEVEVPSFWSQSATNIVASKYFRGQLGEPGRESSVRELIGRVVRQTLVWAIEGSYFESQEALIEFRDRLCFFLVNQYAAFNSPVWFNLGWKGRRQATSACYINSIDDSMDSILEMYKTEGMLFKDGSGSGINLSALRSSKEKLTAGGHSSGPVSFMKGLDASAGSIKSGGSTRRAACMRVLNSSHPDILEFIECKADAEKKAHALIDAGFNGAFNVPYGAYDSVPFQNANHSVRVDDEFMNAYLNDEKYALKEVLSGKVVEMVSARQVMKAISKAAWVCGDPGLQYDTIINDWNPVLDTLRINASNPCCFVGDTLVETSEGPMTMRALQELSAAGKPLPLAFSYDLKIGMPVLRQIKRAWIAGKTSDIVSVVTQRGLSFECTPEHRFLTYDGDYIQAKDLAEGTRLRKVAFTRNEQRSNRLSIMHKTTDDSPNGCTYLSRWMWEQVHGSVPEGFEVHHQDGSAWNDKLSNFELVEGSKHRSLHSRGKGNPRFIECSLENLVEVWEAIEQSEKRTHRQLPKVSIARWNSYVRKNSLQGKVPIASSKGEGRIQGRPWPLFEEAVREHQEKVNDRILSVTPAVSKEVEVFDIEVEETNNFCITTRVIHGHDGIVETARPLHSIVVHNSEYMYIDDSACNLASINLLKFFTHDKENGPSFNEQLFEEACQVLITAQEIFVGFADYPTKKIEKNSHAHRPLGLGFCNLGALLMAYGLPYDSEEGRALASAITSLMSAAAYEQSSKIAAKLGPFEAFEANRKSFSKVIAKHLEANNEIVISPRIAGIRLAAKFTWERVLEACRRGKGVRNGQISVLAPTGTISFIMDADTTGIEPDIALVKYKTLVGGGTMKLVNGVIPLALKGLGYHEDQIKAITHYINQEDTIEGAPFLKETDLPIFDCAFKAENGIRFIKPEGHLKMMAACQPFISGAISKTVNMPNSATEEEIERTYVLAWKLGLKCVALYRDGCKRTQPLSVKKVEDHALSSASLSNQSLDEPVGNPLSPGSLHPVFDEPLLPAAPRSTGMGKDTGHRGSNQPVRRRLPNDRVSLTHKFSIGGHEGYLTIGFYADGLPGEIFIRMNKEGSTISGLMDTIAILTSLGLQYGVPIETLSDKLAHTQYEPRGMTDNQEIPFATSIPDYLFRFLQAQYGEEARKAKAQPELPMKLPEKSEGKSGRPALSSKEIDKLYEADEKLKKGIDKFALTTTKNGKAQDATRICPNCGSLMQWAGRCMACPSCGTSGGCG